MHLPFLLLPPSLILLIIDFPPKFSFSVGCLTVLLPYLWHLLLTPPISNFSSFPILLISFLLLLLRWVLTLSTFHPNPFSNRLSSHSLSSSLTISQDNTMINISMLYPSCVCDIPRMSCLAQPLIQSLRGLLLPIHLVLSSLLSISFFGCEQPECPLVSFPPPSSLPVT